MQKGQRQSEQAKQKIREARKKQVHPSLARRGITAEMVAEAQGRNLKWCGGECHAFRPLNEFSSPRSGQCRKCCAAAVSRVRESWTPEQHAESVENIKAWRHANSGYEKRYRLLRYYGVTPEWYHEKLAEQNDVCALCFSEKSRTSSHHFCVDHNHKTGKVRGLLCAKCNTALERFESDPDWPDRARVYLARYS